MNFSIINQFCDMSMKELYDWIENQTYLGKELETFKKGKEMIDKLSEFSVDDSPNRVMIGLIAYTIYKARGGKND